jgi:hypothetical protein
MVIRRVKIMNMCAVGWAMLHPVIAAEQHCIRTTAAAIAVYAPVSAITTQCDVHADTSKWVNRLVGRARR